LPNCQKSFLLQLAIHVSTAKIRLWDPAIRSTYGLEDLLQLWLRTQSYLDCSVREVGRFFLQNDKDIKMFRYIGSPAITHQLLVPSNQLSIKQK
jgi:hypothetical protein